MVRLARSTLVGRRHVLIIGRAFPFFLFGFWRLISNHCYNDDSILQIMSIKTQDHNVPDSTVKRMDDIIDDGREHPCHFFLPANLDVRFHSHIPDLNSLTG